MKNKVTNTEYDGKSIQQLPYPLNVRKRPQMYLGDLDSYGSLTCLREIVNNSVDEFLRGFCKTISVVRFSEGQFVVSDNGRGVPFDIHSSGKNTLEVIFGELHSGRNFDDDNKTEYSTGINGVGASCVSAVSSSFKVTSKRLKQTAFVEFKEGVISKKGKESVLINDTTSKSSGTVIDFLLDPTLFSSYASEEEVEKLLRETAYLNNGLKITYKSFHSDEIKVWSYENGLEEFLLQDSLSTKDTLVIKPVSFQGKSNDIVYEVSFSWSKDFKPEQYKSFCNTIYTSEGGTHVTGFKRALSQHLTSYIKQNKLVKEDIENDDVFNGLCCYISVFVYKPKYTSQLKQKLSNTEVNGISFGIASTSIKDWIERNPKTLKVVAERVALTARVRIASKRAVENVKKESSSFLSSLNSISKYSDCFGKTQEDECELLIVEGRSAAGTVCDARDKTKQAVYELKGKVLNVLNYDEKKIASNNEISDFISIMKCGTGENCKVEKTKFSKIIIMADSDDDGAHIKLLAATDILHLMTPLVENGMVYFALPPLYRLTATGKKPVYLKSKKELDKFYLDEVKKTYSFNLGGKKLGLKEQEKIFHELMEYSRELEKFSNKLMIEPSVLETALLANFNPDKCIFEFDSLNEDAIIIDEDDDTISISGVFTDSERNETFIAIINEDFHSFAESFLPLCEKFNELKEVEFVRNDGKENSSPFLYSKISNVTYSLRKTWQELRFKGLGECNPDELWDTTINPETRDLIQISIEDIEEAKEISRNFMSKKNVNFRKEFMLDVFDKLDSESLSF